MNTSLPNQVRSLTLFLCTLQYLYFSQLTQLPLLGTWGIFPRPKSISKAYGGGRRVGAGITNAQTDSVDSTSEKLRALRERIGIEVQSEKDNKDVIEEAIALAGRAMSRGSYSSGISALEKVTQYCSSRSELGGKVFLDLAMLYEAEGRTDQALSLYATLAKSPIDKIKVRKDITVSAFCVSS